MPTPLLEAVVGGYAPPIHPLTVGDLRRMLEIGVVSEGVPIELIDGILVRKDQRDPGTAEGAPMGHGPQHAYVISLIEWAFAALHPHPGWLVRVQLPLEIPEIQTPEPDLAIVRGTLRDFKSRHPGPADVVVLFEVSGTSLRYDQTTKLRVYAQAGIPTYVIVNLSEGQVEMHDTPECAAGLYRNRTILTRGEKLRLNLPESASIAIDVDSILPDDPT